MKSKSKKKITTKCCGPSSNGTNVPFVVMIVFVILKLCDLIDWSWWWVLSPMWVVAIMAVVGGVGFLIFKYCTKKGRKMKWRDIFKNCQKKASK